MFSLPVSSLRSLTVAACLVSCASDAANRAESEHDAAHAHASPSDLMDDDDFKGCPDGIPPFEPGLQAKGKHLAVKLLSAAPTEPGRYSNHWKVEADTLDGVPAADAKITKSQTFMPIHGHDGMVVPEVAALSSMGQFSIDKLTFTMRGPWEVRFWLSGTAVAEDYIVLNVCVAK